MFEELEEIIISTISLPNNVSVKKDNNLDYYLGKLTKQEVFNALVGPMAVKKDDTKFLKALLLRDKKKNEIIKALKNQLPKSIEMIFPYFKDQVILGIEILIEKNGFLAEVNNFPMSCAFLLSSFNLIFIKYIDKKIVIHCPQEILNLFKNNIEKDSTDIRKKNNEINDFVTSMLEVYGVVKLEWLHYLFEKNFHKISLAEFKKIITAYIFLERYLIVIADDESCEYIATEDEDEAYALLYSVDENYDYKEFSKFEINQIINNEYLGNLKSSQKLISYLKENFDMEKESVWEFITQEVHNFVMLANEDYDDAEKFLDTMIEKLFEVDIETKKEMRKLITAIYDEYPKYSLKGHAK